MDSDQAICEIAVDATPRFVTADESGVISGWTLDKPGVTDAAMVPDDATEPFTANKLTGFSVINVAGYRFPLVACGYRVRSCCYSCAVGDDAHLSLSRLLTGCLTSHQLMVGLGSPSAEWLRRPQGPHESIQCRRK